MARAIVISPSLPTGINGTPVDCSAVGNGDFSSCNPGALIKNIYQFSLLIAGVLALGAIVYGGITYTISAGNPSKQHEGTEWIRSALWGLLLLASAYLILNTIDPRLTSVGLPGLTVVTVPTTGGGGGGGGGGFGNLGPGCAGGGCLSLRDAGLTCKDPANQPGGIDSCSAPQAMIDTLNCLKQNGAPAFTVTEAIPPTVPHSDQCHNNGCCVDTTINSGSCDDVSKMIAAAKACGAPAPINEYVKCGGANPGTRKGDNVHIYSKVGGSCSN